MLNLSGIRDVRPKPKDSLLHHLEHLRREIMKGTISRQEVQRKFRNYTMFIEQNQV